VEAGGLQGDVEVGGGQAGVGQEGDGGDAGAVELVVDAPLLLYNLIFVLPSLLLLADHLALGDRAAGPPERLCARVGGAAREGMLWLVGLVGFALLADALAHFGG
jgi:hypothetical protein